MIIEESEIIFVVAGFVLIVVFFKNIEFLVKRSHVREIWRKDVRKIEERLDILESWMGMDKKEEQNQSSTTEEET